LIRYCPADAAAGAMRTEFLWLVYGFIAVVSPIGLLVSRQWMMKGFKTKHAP
jgi:uncharacterized membrane protein